MSWKERYLKASFRNVEFVVTNAGNDGGRRTVKHTFPNNDTPYFEDLGRKNPQFTLEAFVVGEDYDAQRNKLENALNTPDFGRLVHPYKGAIDVVCIDYNVTETSNEGGVARFSITFGTQNEIVLTEEFVSTKLNAVVKKKSFLEKVQAWFAEAYAIGKAPMAILDKAKAGLDEISNTIASVKKVASLYDEYNQAINNLKGSILSIALDAEDLGKKIQDIVDFGTDAQGSLSSVPNAKAQVAELRTLVLPSSALVVNNVIDNQKILQSKIALGSIVGLVGEVSFGSIQEASLFRDYVTNSINALIESDLVTDDEFSALQDLRTAMNVALEEQVENLSQLREVVVGDTVPAIVVSASLYGTIDKAEEIVARNEIEHNGFCNGAIPLKVLVNDN